MKVKNRIFALDIGTRSVVGIILEKQNEIFHVLDILSIEHSERAMLDGQIHDVLAVSKVITEIKEQLEEKYGPLHKVCVAAAGRSLKTERAKVSVDINGKPMLTKQDILHLELSAVQQAQSLAAEISGPDHVRYYCVGYSVLFYRLDGQEMGNLIDQTGEEASVEIIATFLPKVVVESLLSALQRTGLEMEALTLEPIAAINVLIPQSMRRLNVALVDIGAGTSDIAITDSGTVIAYGMVPIAGDEITEAISDQFLLDFPLAEKAKRELNAQESITITDILGFETEVSKADVVKQISPAIDQLAGSIRSEILSLNNQKPPKAVMLVGGGSLTPGLTERLAQLLELPSNRVAVRGIDAISSLTIADTIHKGPELVTPIGIALAAQHAPVQYVTVYVNDQPIRLFEIKALSVGDCLLAAGIKMNKLYGKPGLAKIVSVENQTITIPGKLGNPPIILKNGEFSSLDEVIKNGDNIIVTKGNDGEQTDLRIKDLIDHYPVRKITLNGEPTEIMSEIICNGKKVSSENLVLDRDEIIIRNPHTIKELLIALKKDDMLSSLEPFCLTVNGTNMAFPSLSGNILLNGQKTTLNDSFEDRDHIEITARGKLTVEEWAEMKQLKLLETIPVTFNGERVILEKVKTEIIRNHDTLKKDELLFHNDILQLIEKEVSSFIFQDLFNHVEIEMPEKVNGHFLLLKNNNHTTFYDNIAPGDDLQIVWPSPETLLYR
ncbi:MAG: cell division protein FtsA [Bacillota bacterium]|nr:cell division protein FtsA [Bacillota bacterium]